MKKLELPPMYGCYPGIVVNTKDPEKEGKVRVRVDQAYGAAEENEKIEDDDLPWARPAFPVSGLGSGTPHVPPPESGVWVMFWGGKRSKPVWFGCYFGESDVPAEFVSAYSPEPNTRLVKTANGHEIEMRWKEGESEIRVKTANGVEFRLIDDQAAGGLKIEGATPGGYSFAVDEQSKRIEAKTPTQTVEIVETPPKVAVTTPGDFEVTAGGKTTQSFALSSVITAVVALLVTAGTTLGLTAAGILTLTGASVVVASVTGLVSLGLAGVKFKLVDERFIALVQIPNTTAHNANGATFAGHTHAVAAAPGQSGPPELPPGTPATFGAIAPAAPGTHTTVSTVAN